MSDVTVAPNASPPPSNEVVIEQNPTSAPQPIGSQAPSKPVGDIKGSPHRPESRRETIQKAYEKARAEIKPREARMGDNNPPEAMEKEKPRQQELDLRKRPTQQRGEHGHFATRQEESAASPGQSRPDTQEQASQASQPSQASQIRQLPDNAPFRDALPRMTEAAKQDWHSTPESVRGDIHRIHQEYDNGFRRFRADHDVMNTLRPFQQMAQQQGTTLQRALNNYVTMEHKLRADPIGGLDLIVSNLNLQHDGRKLTLRDIAYHVLNQSPEQHQLTQNQNAQAAQSQQIGQLHQMVNTLAHGIQRMQYEKKFTDTRSALDRYADDGKHARFNELAPIIKREVELGFDLDTAYRRAELLQPASQAAQTRNGTQPRASDRSIHGAPDAGPSNGPSRRSNGKPVTGRQSIANAIKRVNGSL